MRVQLSERPSVCWDRQHDNACPCPAGPTFCCTCLPWTPKCAAPATAPRCRPSGPTRPGGPRRAARSAGRPPPWATPACGSASARRRPMPTTLRIPGLMTNGAGRRSALLLNRPAPSCGQVKTGGVSDAVRARCVSVSVSANLEATASSWEEKRSRYACAPFLFAGAMSFVMLPCWQARNLSSFSLLLHCM